MTPDQFRQHILDEGGSSRLAADLLSISKTLAALDRADAAGVLPLDPPPAPDAADRRAANRRKLMDKLKKTVRAAGHGWRAETGSWGVRVAAPGRLAMCVVPWD